MLDGGSNFIEFGKNAGRDAGASKVKIRTL
jgi:hypothetical protein